MATTLVATFFLLFNGYAQLRVARVRCEGLVDPVGIGVSTPRLSWQIRAAAGDSGVMQTAYELRVGEEHPGPDGWGEGHPGSGARGEEHPRSDPRGEGHPGSDGWGEGRLVWQSGKVLSAQCIGVPVKDAMLQPGQKYSWQVRVWDNKGRVSEWSVPSSFRIGFLQAADWHAQWISPSWGEDSVRRVPPVFRRAWTVGREKKVRSATLSITAHGLYEALLNGRRVGSAYLTPGWTSYDKRLQYQVYEVGDLLKTGDNQVRVTVGDGWWRGVFGGAMKSNNYGRDAALLFQLDIVYEDGSRSQVVSDKSWQAGMGPIRYADLYNGEVYDARVSVGGFMPVKVLDLGLDNLAATVSEPVRQQESFKPVKIWTSPKGETLIDFGQNLAGWVQCRFAGQAGDTVTVSHAEALDKDGNFYTGNLREARAEDVYVLSGGRGRLYEPHFTFHGFRYVKIKGVRRGLKPGDLTAVALYSDLARTGSFECSNPLLNQLQHNINWSQRDNFVDLPTDCPQRSERYGWTGDVQIFARTASYNMDVSSFFSKWMKDLAADQDSLGGVPVIIPDLNGHRNRGLKRGVAGWGDAATIVPWTLFRAYGDTGLLREQYPAMKAWVNYIRHFSPLYVWSTGGYGDWLAPDTLVQTPVPFICQAYYAHSCELVVKAASVLGEREDSVQFSALLRGVRAAFMKYYWPLPQTQTGYAMALDFDLLPDSLRASAASRLVELVHSHNDHLSTGFLGTPALLPVLSRWGFSGVAFDVLAQDTPPSWLYPVKMGATTIWEKWDAILPDGTVGEKSLNHYSYGAVGDWLYRTVAGISETSPGYKTFRIEPHPGGGLSWVRAGYETPYGKIVCEWKVEGGMFKLHLEVPANTEAELVMPGGQAKRVGAGTADLSAPVTSTSN